MILAQQSHKIRAFKGTGNTPHNVAVVLIYNSVEMNVSSVCYFQMPLKDENADSKDIIAVFPREEELVYVSEQLWKRENESREENGSQPVFKRNIYALQDANHSQDRSVK